MTIEHAESMLLVDRQAGQLTHRYQWRLRY
jgi:hypothetical protein